MIEQNKIAAIIVDDEHDARESLEILLQDISIVKLVGQFDSVEKAIDFISTHKTQLVFLDIDMPGKNGFELIRELKDLHLQPTIIFTTAYPQHAIEAIEEAAFGYLLKPIDPGKLRKTVNKYCCSQKLDHIPVAIEKLKFKTRTGFVLIDKREVVYCHADGSYTEIVLINGRTLTVSQNIGHLETLLIAHPFYRLGRSNIINLDFVRKVNRKERICIIEYLGKEAKLEIPRKQLIELEKLL